MEDIPRDPALDSTVALLREGYGFISRRCDRLGSDAFQTRLMLKKVVCARGAEASEMFYRHGRFTRRGAIPRTTLALLQDKGSVQTLDAEAHLRRKAMFMALTGAEAAARLAEIFAEEWNAEFSRRRRDDIVLFDMLRLILTRTALNWTGVPPGAGGAEERCRELTAMVDNAGKFGPRYWHARLLRRRTERWAQQVIHDVRAGLIKLPQTAPAAVLAAYREDGRELAPEIAAVELINLLRPVVAVSRFIIFAALALHQHPQVRKALASDKGGEQLAAFVQEVRRTTPFFPMIGGRARTQFDWRGHRFRKGDWVLLDLYSTNLDPRLWVEPQAFRPERFHERQPGPHSLIPQGGGDPHTDHRCPGEAITIALMERAAHILTREVRYEVPDQDLSVDLTRMPTLPASGFIIANTRPAA